MASKPPFFVLIPGASHNPSHFGYLFHLLHLAGYPIFSAVLPSVGASDNVTMEDDTAYIREKMLIPVLDYEQYDVIIISHSYSGVPVSAAAHGLSKAARAKEGKKTGVVGQIFYRFPAGEGADANLLHCDDRIPPLLQDVAPELADAAAASAVAHGLTSFISPCPRATWDSDEYKGRIAYIRTLNDRAIPLQVQQMLIDGTGAEWIVRDIESGHSPHVAQPEKLRDLLVELAELFTGL